MSEFKENPYLYFYPGHWLGKTTLRRLRPDVKGFYIDFICLLHEGFPVGYCSQFNEKKTKALQKLVKPRLNQSDNLRLYLLLNFSVQEQLKLSVNIENELTKHLPYTQEEITLYIRILEDNMIISRDPSGVIFVRRSVRDFRSRVVAYLNGSKGGNKALKTKKTTGNSNQSRIIKKLNNSDLQSSDNPRDNQTGYSNAITYPYNKKEGRGAEPAVDAVPKFALQKMYDRTYENLMETRYWNKLKKESFENWKKFIDWVIEMEWTDLFIAKPFGPKDYQLLEETGVMERTRLQPIIEKILSSGVKPEHTLFFRIPEYEKFVKTNAKLSGSRKTDTKKLGTKDYSSMKGVKKT